MATGSQVNVAINVTAPGLAEANKHATKLHDTLKGAAAAAQNFRMPMATAAARQGVAAQAAYQAGGQASGTNLSRGIGGVTGAEGRDFAKQAQGLGGLVHVYATFAANLFAATAAFGALKSAMDTTNMVKGLDQLGAASGMALGSLSKRLVQATDGAISLREAMEATAKASSSGMSSTQILRMGEAAKKASQALGVDMSDAVSRISRGITKLEPELLDELGIFVRIDDVVKNYASSVGKAASALTDFERRQAFANAVLDQAEKKFSAIEIDSNPYAKLLASMKDVAQTGLELVNTVLSPVVNLLASSPSALALAMGGIASILLKQAIPALGAFRKNAKDAADAALELANTRNKEAAAAGVEGAKRGLTAESKARIALLKEQINAENALLLKAREQREIDAEVQANKAINNLGGKIGKKTLDLLKKPVDELTPGELGLVDKNIARAKAAVSKADTEANRQRLQDYQSIKTTIEIAQKADEKYTETVTINRAKITEAEQQVVVEEAKRQKIKANYWSVEAAAQRTADAANKAALSRSISASAGEITRVEGIRAAYTKLNADIARSKVPQVLDTGVTVPAFSILNAGFTRVKGLIGIATTAAEIFSSVISRVFFIVGTISAVYGVLNSVLSKNTKEADKFNEALESTKNTGELLSNVLKGMATKDLNEVLSVSSSKTIATAFNEVSDSLVKLASEFDNVITATNSNIWDSTWDKIFSIVGKDYASKFSKEFGNTLALGIAAIPEGKLKDTAKDKISKILNTTDVSSAGIEKALNKLPDSVKNSTVKSILVLVNETNKGVRSSSEVINSFSSAIDNASKAYGEYLNTLTASDPISKLGNTMMEAAAAMALALEDPKNALISLSDIMKDVNKLRLFSPAAQKSLVDGSKEVNRLKYEIASYEKRIAEQEKALKEAMARTSITPATAPGTIKGIDSKTGMSVTPSIIAQSLENTKKGVQGPVETKPEVVELRNQLVGLRQGLKDTTKIAETTVKNYDSLSQNMFKRAYELITRPLVIAQQEASVSIARARAAGMSGAGTAEITASLRREEIGIRLQTNRINANLNDTMAEANMLMAENNNLTAMDIKSKDLAMLAQKDSTPEIESRAEVLGAELAILEKTRLAMQEVRKFSKGAVSFDKLSPEARQMASEQQKSRIASQAERTQLGAQSTVVGIEEEIGKRKELFDISQRKLKVDIDSKTLALENLRNATSYFSILSETTLEKRQSAEIDIESANDKRTIAELDFKIAEAALRVSKESNAERALAFGKNLTDLQAQKKEYIDIQKARDSSQEVKRAQERIKNSSLIAQVEADTQSITLSNLNEIAQLENTNASNKLASVLSTGAIEETTGTKRKLALDLENEALSLQKDLLAAIDTKNKSIADIATRAAMARAAIPTTDSKALADLTRTQGEEEARVNKTLSDRIALLMAASGIRVKSIELTATDKLKADELNQSLIKRNESLENMVSITESLSAAFGTVGENIGKMGEALTATANAELAYLEKKQILEDRQKDIDPLVRAKAQQDLNKLEKKYTIDQISGTEKVAASAKKMFSEKSAAYKVLNNMEKAAAAYKLALQLKEMALDVTKFMKKIFFIKAEVPLAVGASAAKATAEVAAESVSLPAKIAGGIASLVSQGGFLGFAAVGAFMALLGSFGGSKTGPSIDMTGLTSADRQEVQGTGQTWQGGKKVDTGGGVFGDSSAKSTAIADSLEVIKANSILGLDYDNKMLKALQKLADSIVGAAKSLYSVPGLRAGTGFGTSEGATAGGSGGLLGSIFGGKTTSTTSIQSAGLQFRGTFDDLMNSITTSVVQYKDVLTQYTKSGGWFKKDKAWATLSRETQALEAGVSASISDIFKDANALFLEIGRKTSVTASTIQDTLKTFNTSFDLDLKGLTGEALVAEINGVVGNILSEAAGALFKGFEMFREFGEDYLETVLRVVDGNNKVNQALISIGTSFSVLSKFNISETLIKNAGGLETFMEQTSFFKENFLTAAEQLAPVQKAVSQQLVNLGLNANITKEQFKGLVLAQDLGTEAGRSLYQNLMELAPGFMAVQDTVESTKSSISNLIIELLKAQGKTAEALALTRAKELATLSDSEKIIKQHIYALEDESALRAKILAARDKERAALNATINTLGKYIDTLKAQKLALLGGTNSILTPKEKYEQAKLRAEELAVKATASATTETEIEARNKALDELPSANTAFLEASRAFYASSDTYARDFNSVISTIDSTAGLLELQKTDAEKQVELLESSTAFLDAISKSTETTASLLAEYLANQTRFTEALNFVPPTEAEVQLIATLANIESTLTNVGTVLTESAAEAAAAASATETGTAATTALTEAVSASNFLSGTAATVVTTGNTGNTGGSEPVITGGFNSSTTSAERAAYYAENPTMAAITSTAIDIFGYSSLGMAINALTDSIAMENAKAETTGVAVGKVAGGAQVAATNLGVLSTAVEGATDSAVAFAESLGPVGDAAGMSVSDVPEGFGLATYATGGLASGLSLVGELGPELVDFNTPGRVYTAQQTKGMFANGGNNEAIQRQLIDEVKNLRKEVQLLREQQNKETGHLINATYDAQNRAANDIVAGTQEAAEKQAWNARLAQKAVLA